MDLLSYTTDICHTLHQCMSVAQGRFLGGSGHRAKAHRCPAVPKMPCAPLAFPFLGCLRHQAINLTPPRRVKAWGDSPLRLEVYPVLSHIWLNRLAQHSQPKCDLDTRKSHVLSYTANSGILRKTDHLILAKRPDLVIVNKKKKRKQKER